MIQFITKDAFIDDTVNNNKMRLLMIQFITKDAFLKVDM